MELEWKKTREGLRVLAKVDAGKGVDVILTLTPSPPTLVGVQFKAQEGGDPLTVERMRAVQVATYVQQARRALEKDPRWIELSTRVKGPRMGRRGPGKESDRFFALRAEKYCHLLDAGSRRPIADLANTFGVSTNAASAWITEARRRRLLSALPKGSRFGGQLTKKGKAALLKRERREKAKR